MLSKFLSLFSRNRTKNSSSSEHLENFKPAYQHFTKGKTYIISKQFQDYDYKIHNVGTVIEFLGYNFFPYDAGLTLLFNQKSSEYVIRLRLDQEDSQSEVNENLEQYIAKHEEKYT